MRKRFQDELVVPVGLFAVGTDLETGRRYLSFPVNNITFPNTRNPLIYWLLPIWSS